MEISYKKELGALYMVIPARRESAGYAEKALLSHKLAELLEAHISVVDGEAAYYYDISGLIPLEKYLSMKQLGYRELQLLLRQITAIPEKMEAYLISDRHILLNPQTIFIDKSYGHLYFCGFPENEEDYMEGLRNLALYFLRKIDHQDEACVSLAYEFFDRVSEGTCDIRELKKICAGGEDKESGEDCGEDTETSQNTRDYDGTEDEDIWDVNPALKEMPEKTGKINKEFILKAAGIGTPVVAVIIVGILLFL